jgi:UDP-glucose 4-epimerase
MVIVTGGLGFIGNELVRQLMSADEKVIIIDNKNRVAPDIDDIARVQVEDIDITDFSALSEFFKSAQPRVIYHMAAIHYIPECNENPERTLRVNVEGTQSILRAASLAGVQKIVFASSGAVYADSASPLSESSPIGPVDIYGWTKLFGEQLCHLIHAQFGIPIVICRLFNNYGPRETNAHIIPEIINQLRTGNTLRLGNISTVRDYIHTSDCAEAIIRLSKLNEHGIVVSNVASGRGFTVHEIIQMIERSLGRPIHVQHDNKRFRKFDKQTQVADISCLHTLTGWTPQKSVDKGMADLLAYENLR